MKRLTSACAMLALTGCVVPGMPGMDPMGVSQAQMQEANMMAAQSSAQAAAVRPGDEALSCDALQTEMRVMFNDPAFQATVASMGASAQAQMDKAKAAQAGMVGASAAGMAAGFAGSIIPGMGWLGSAAAQAQQAAAMAQVPEANRNRAQMAADVTSMMPQIYRGQRIHDLAIAKKCAFLNNPAPA